jgi:hypothetical protein
VSADPVGLVRITSRLKEASYPIAVCTRHREKLNAIANLWIASYDYRVNHHFLCSKPESDIQISADGCGDHGLYITSAQTQVRSLLAHRSVFVTDMEFSLNGDFCSRKCPPVSMVLRKITHGCTSSDLTHPCPYKVSGEIGPQVRPYT